MMTRMATALLLTETGCVFYGHKFGYQDTFLGELCFTTAMAGYQEVLTDPSYMGQILCFTFPHIGNTGINTEDSESEDYGAGALVTAALPSLPSHYQACGTLEDFVQKRRIVGISGVDTRAITQAISQRGDMKALVTHNVTLPLGALQEKLSAWEGLSTKDLAQEVSCKAPFIFSPAQGRGCVVVIDFGVKKSILVHLSHYGYQVIVTPAYTSASEILAYHPRGIVLSNGPGDPRLTATFVQETLLTLLESHVPIFGICLGHQLLALALGGQVEKMRTGHRGVNHPVKDKEQNKVVITSMNHGYSVFYKTLPPQVQETHVSLFDGTNCGFRLKNKPVMAVQFHPEACAGTKDAQFLFQKFDTLMTAYVKS